MSAKIHSTYKINDVMRAKLRAASENSGHSMTKILEDLIAGLDEGQPTKFFQVVRVDPLFLKGEEWSGKYTGNVRLIYPDRQESDPNGSEVSLRIVEFFLNDCTFRDFTHDFSKIHLKWMEVIA